MKTIKEHLWNLDNFISWLEQKDPKETYDYWDTCNCLLSQYMQAQGFPEAEHWGMDSYCLTGRDKDARHDMPAVFRDIALAGTAYAIPKEECIFTFGEALDRARRVRAGAYQTT